jgi:hypothetical protein
MIYRKLFFIIITISCCALPFKGLCQDEIIPQESYIATKIPDSLKKDANSVMRYSYDEVKLKSPTDAVHLHHEILTILNEKGDQKIRYLQRY